MKLGFFVGAASAFNNECTTPDGKYNTPRLHRVLHSIFYRGNTFIKLESDAISHAKMICLNAFLAAHQEIQCVFPSVTELNLRVLMTVHATQTVLRDAHAPPNKVKRDGSTLYISHIL